MAVNLQDVLENRRADPSTPDDPLGDNVQGYTFFRYPSDLGNDEYPHYVAFFINIPVASEETDLSPTQKQNFSKIFGADQSTVVRGGLASTSTINTNLVTDQKTSNSPGNQLVQPIYRTNTAIALYMPPKIISGLEINWSSKDLNLLGAVTKDALSDGNATFWDRLKHIGGDALQSVFMGGLRAVDNLSDEFKSVDTISAFTHIAVNPHAEVLFSGINFRSFQFVFQFTPRNETEAQATFNIIRLFRYHSTPELVQSTLGGRYWVYPSEFDIKFYSHGLENTFIPKISTCALVNVTVDYTGADRWASYRQTDNLNGVPVTSSLSLQFVELELLSKSRVRQGY